jgi:hypothetical protein
VHVLLLPPPSIQQILGGLVESTSASLPAITPAGTHFKLEEVKEAILETQVPKRGGKCFLEG